MVKTNTYTFSDEYNLNGCESVLFMLSVVFVPSHSGRSSHDTEYSVLIRRLTRVRIDNMSNPTLCSISSHRYFIKYDPEFSLRHDRYPKQN